MQENTQVDTEQTGQRKFRCRICGYIYVGEELPLDFHCPRCGSDRDQMIELR